MLHNYFICLIIFKTKLTWNKEVFSQKGEIKMKTMVVHNLVQDNIFCTSYLFYNINSEWKKDVTCKYILRLKYKHKPQFFVFHLETHAQQEVAS